MIYLHLFFFNKERFKKNADYIPTYIEPFYNFLSNVCQNVLHVCPSCPAAPPATTNLTSKLDHFKRIYQMNEVYYRFRNYFLSSIKL